MLLDPSALAVTWTTPVPPGLQVLNVASQCPAQATPFEAMFRIEVSVEEYVTGVFRVVPEAV
jgi:hypothetical protein